MILKNFEFDHSAKTLNHTMKMSTKTMFKCRERVFFSTITHALQMFECEMSEVDPPMEISTISGTLQYTLNLVSDELEYEFTLLNFSTMHSMAQSIVKNYLIMENTKGPKSKEIRLLFELNNSVVESRLNEDDDCDEFDKSPTPKMLYDRCNLVKKSNFNWNTYYNMVVNQIEGHSEVDDILNNLFSNPEDSVD